MFPFFSKAPKPMSPANIRAQELSWPTELVVCKKILEVVAGGKPLAYKAQYGRHKVGDYLFGAVVALFADPTNTAVTGYARLEAGFYHGLVECGDRAEKGVVFTATCQHAPLKLQMAVSVEDMGKESERKRIIEFMGNRLLHSVTNPRDFHKTGAAGPSVSDEIQKSGWQDNMVPQ